jgi:hypothetical protein
MIMLASRMAVSLISLRIAEALSFFFCGTGLFRLLFESKLFQLAFDLVLPSEEIHALQVPYDTLGLKAWF